MNSVVFAQTYANVSLPLKRKHSETVGWSARTMPNMYNPPTHAKCTKLYLDDVTHIGLVIGKNGAVFNAITHQTPDVEYIWYDKDSKTIEVWGNSSDAIHNALEKLWKRINDVNSMKKFDRVHTNVLAFE